MKNLENELLELGYGRKAIDLIIKIENSDDNYFKIKEFKNENAIVLWEKRKVMSVYDMGCCSDWPCLYDNGDIRYDTPQYINKTQKDFMEKKYMKEILDYYQNRKAV